MALTSSAAQYTSSRKWLLILLAIVFLSRLLFALIAWKINGSEVFISPDTASYLTPAGSLLHGQFLSNGAFVLRDTPEIFRTPGYPLLLMPAVASRRPVLLAILENLLLAVLSAWLIWRITNELVPGSGAAKWAVLLYCFEPVGFLHSERILSETLFTTLLLVFIWLFLKALHKPGNLPLLFSALALGCATYVRPVSLYLGLWLVPVLLLWPGALSWRKRLARATIFPIILALTVLPWSLRNSYVAGYRGFSTSADWNLYFLSAAALESKLEHRSRAQLSGEWVYESAEQYHRAHPEMRTWSDAQIAQFWGLEAKRIIKAHPLMYAGIHARGCAIVVFSPGVSDLLRDAGLYPNLHNPITPPLQFGWLHTVVWLAKEYPYHEIFYPLLLVQLLLYYLLALAGLRRLTSASAALFCALFIYFVLVSGFPAAVSRYRAPVIPAVCICAGLGLPFRTTGLLPHLPCPTKGFTRRDALGRNA